MRSPFGSEGRPARLRSALGAGDEADSCSLERSRLYVRGEIPGAPSRRVAGAVEGDLNDGTTRLGEDLDLAHALGLGLERLPIQLAKAEWPLAAVARLQASEADGHGIVSAVRDSLDGRGDLVGRPHERLLDAIKLGDDGVHVHRRRWRSRRRGRGRGRRR